jgi:hypothetical protein
LQEREIKISRNINRQLTTGELECSNTNTETVYKNAKERKKERKKE